MNVKITYTVPFDEIPDKLEKLVQDSISKKLLSDIQYFTVSKSNPAIALQELDYLRRTLGSLDLLYQDVSAILAGYCEELDKEKNGEQV